MSATGDRRAELAGKLTAAGVTPVVLDPRAVPPFVLLGAPAWTGSAGVGGWTVAYPVHVVAPGPATLDTLDWLLDTAEQVIRTLGYADATPTTYGERDSPAYTLIYAVDVTNPDC